MKIDMENLKVSMVKILIFFRRIDQLLICEKKVEGLYNLLKLVKVYVLNFLYVLCFF